MKKTKFSTVLLSFMLLIAGNTSTQAQGIMTTWVGDSTAGYTGDGGPASLAEISGPHDICFDAAHNFYFIDQNNYAIRKVSASTGYISTLAANGMTFSLDGTVITDSFGQPAYLCVDGAGNVYFTDDYLNEVFKINGVTGIATVIAGNGIPGYSGDGSVGTNAQLSYPMGICLDASANVYVVDYGNNVIRKINATTGIITTVAGTGIVAYTGDGGPATAATFSNPMCICIDPSGNLYVADEGNYAIRKIAAATGIITTIAGNGTYGFSGEGGPATSASIGSIDGICIDAHGDIYIDDISCSCRKISAATGNINIVAGDPYASGYTGDGGSAISELLNEPAGLCVDPSNGNIIIADWGNNRLRKATQPGYGATGVKNVTTSSQLSIFPNPSSGKFTIQTSAQQKNTGVDICNTVGEIVYSATINGTQNNIDISTQPAGIYFVKINSADGLQTLKITINN